ncbi:hypothetical protein HCN44_003708 [Aphidius gifuensis]|uniref:Uncharacterized protein n=1 Tax=Aphidius gifuensis TaxID=684658 RepID=A0A835CP86_APHGI|nr:hypothetical protein HCN44_003708 [Aphidius gifuensis]
MADLEDHEKIAEVLSRILLKFSQKYDKKIKMSKRFHHIEIGMIRDGDICEIQLSNYGKIINKNDEIYDICKFGYSDMVINDESVLIIAIIRNFNSNEEEIFDVSSWRGTIRVRKIANSTKEELIFPSLSDYLILRIQQKISVIDGEKFVDKMTKHLDCLAKKYSQIKYTFKMGEYEFYNNKISLDDTIINCKLLTSAIDNILMQSVDENFREECFKLLKINNSSEASAILQSNLITIINKKYRI